jgi:nucleoside-diphosphate-sugar epimerase
VRVLVLGGTHHVGRAAVEEALAAGDEVTTVNRGVSRPPAPGVTALVADRTVPGALAVALDGQPPWDAVLDTWSGAPRVVHESARLLSGRAAHYGYVSSRSVYRWPIPPGLDESAPVADGDPDSDEAADYQAAKRGSELAVVDGFDGQALIARAGLVLGPYEITGRLPWWLGRLSDGGPTLAPGPYDRPLQYVDGRDLALWMLGSARLGTTGAFNVVSHRGHATMGSLLDCAVEVTGGRAELVWAAPEVIEEAGIAAWTELPIWLPPTGEAAGLHDADVSAAYGAGLSCRPVKDTVADTWAWLQAEGWPPPRTDRPPVGLDRAREDAVLAQVRG